MARPVIGSAARPRYRYVVAFYDRIYRFVHGLDDSASVGPALCVKIRRCRRARTLPDGTVLQAGDRIGILHLNNDRVTAIHLDGGTPMAVGLEFRRLLMLSLRTLAARATDGGPLAEVRAFEAVTIFHQALQRLGFVPAPRGPAWPRLVGAYQRALLASLHPDGLGRLHRSSYARSRRLWLTRQTLLSRYGAGPATVNRAAGAA
jgi:hypothetical protein